MTLFKLRGGGGMTSAPATEILDRLEVVGRDGPLMTQASFRGWPISKCPLYYVRSC